MCFRTAMHQARPTWHTEVTESVWLTTLTKSMSLSSPWLVSSLGTVRRTRPCVWEMLDTLNINSNVYHQGRLLNVEHLRLSILKTYDFYLHVLKIKISKTWKHILFTWRNTYLTSIGDILCFVLFFYSEKFSVSYSIWYRGASFIWSMCVCI